MTPKVTPKDFFLWAGAMVALFGSIISFITLLFGYIDYVFPDPLEYSYYYSDPFSGGIRFSMAALIVLVPVAIALMRVIRKEIAADSSKTDLWVRRWALFLTVFVAGAAIVIDLITLVNYFLGGELTTRFLLKAGVVLLVAGGAFLHFLADIRGYWSMNAPKAKLVGYAAGIAVLAAIVSGFFIIGTPSEMRLMRFDSQKVADLQNVQWQIISYWQQKEVLPENITDIEDPLSGWMLPKDPQGAEYAYTYKKTGPLSFELCATFNNETMTQGEASIARPTYPYPGPDGENWQHGAGDACFERTIDPERYPPYTKF